MYRSINRFMPAQLFGAFLQLEIPNDLNQGHSQFQVCHSLSIATPRSNAENKKWSGVCIEDRLSILLHEPSLWTKLAHIFRIPGAYPFSRSTITRTSQGISYLISWGDCTGPIAYEEKFCALGDVMSENHCVIQSNAVNTRHSKGSAKDLFYCRIQVGDIRLGNFIYRGISLLCCCVRKGRPNLGP